MDGVSGVPGGTGRVEPRLQEYSPTRLLPLRLLLLQDPCLVRSNDHSSRVSTGWYRRWLSTSNPEGLPPCGVPYDP